MGPGTGGGSRGSLSHPFHTPLLTTHLFFSVLSIGGCVPALFATNWFIREQIAEAPSAPAIALSDQARIVAQQLGNAYGLLFMVGVAVLYTSTELKVVRNYLVALLIADIGHVGLTIVALGTEQFTAIGEWNAMTWGNVGFTVCLVPLTLFSHSFCLCCLWPLASCISCMLHPAQRIVKSQQFCVEEEADSKSKTLLRWPLR